MSQYILLPNIALLDLEDFAAAFVMLRIVRTNGKDALDIPVKLDMAETMIKLLHSAVDAYALSKRVERLGPAYPIPQPIKTPAQLMAGRKPVPSPLAVLKPKWIREPPGKTVMWEDEKEEESKEQTSPRATLRRVQPPPLPRRQ